MRLPFLLIVGLLWLLTGCVGERQVLSYLANHPEVSAAWCAAEYPVQTKFLPGKETITRDTTFLPGAVVDCPETVDPGSGRRYTPQVQCPGQQVIKETRARVDTLEKENTALRTRMEQQVAAAQAQANQAVNLALEAQGRLEKETQQRKDAQRDTWVLAAIIVAGVTWQLVRIIRRV